MKGMRAVLLSLFAFGAVWAQDQTETPTFRTGVANVRVDVQVMDGNRIVTGLTRDDFLLYDNNQPKPITYFDHEKEPVTLLMVLDVSGSMAKYVQQLAISSREALRSLKSGDKVGIMVFARTARMTLPFTDDLEPVPETLREAIREQDLGAGTQINHALVDAAHEIEKSAPASGRRAILIVTDNEAINYQLSDETVIRELHNVNTVCNAIIVGKGRRPATTSRFKNPDFSVANVFAISDETGGDVMKSEKAGEAFAVLLDRIRLRYSIQFAAPEDAAGQFREIRVELKPEMQTRYPSAKLRYRKGYYVR
jgi:VWFA-related protein